MTPPQRTRADIAKVMLQDMPSQQEVAVLLAKFLKQVREALKQTEAEVSKIRKRDDQNVAIAENLKRIRAYIDTNKESLGAAHKSLADELVGLKRTVGAIRAYDDKALRAKFTADIESVIQRIDAIKPFVLLNTTVRDSLETLKGDDRLDASAIKGIEKLIPKAAQSGGGGNILNTKESLRAYDLSSQLDGATKTFNLPAVWRVVSVSCSSAPWTMRPTVDFTWTNQTITFTSEITAAGTLASGQTVIVIYMTA